MPATVAWTPLAWMQTHVASARIQSSHARSARTRNASRYRPPIATPAVSQRSDRSLVKRTAMSVMASRSSMTATEQQDHAHARGQRRAHEREHAEREGDVGRHWDRPGSSLGRRAARDGEDDERRHDHAADGGEDG